ncbi:ABC transporter ATP-binding protein [Actinoallomurus sp. CA-150999]|uniref:ABC transporter ATP-binding protein n=1 Tax=Actinoallomurus sp. CA-150999 TaxID=3239887 RepID=UPI003D9461C0
MNVLEVRGLSVEYAAPGGAVHAVSDVSLDLRRGEILGIAGESGSGKSTLAHAMSRLLRPPARVTAGAVRYCPPDDAEPVDLLTLDRAALRRFRWKELAVVFQSAMNSLNPVSTIGAQIDDVLRTHRTDMSKADRRERAVELLGRVGIDPERRRSYPHELSGGMRQRAVIAIALALNPQIIVMDEPTTALDVVVQRDILHQIKELKDEYGFAVVFITHDLSLLLEIADHIAIMYAGRVVETAPARSVHEAPRHPYTLGLVRSFPKLHGPREELLGIPGTPPDLRSLPPGCAFHPRCRFAVDACRSHRPGLLTTDDGVQVACALHDASVYAGDLPAELSPREETR